MVSKLNLNKLNKIENNKQIHRIIKIFSRIKELVIKMHSKIKI